MEFKNYVIHKVHEDKQTLWSAGNIDERAKYIEGNLKKGEIIEADSLGQHIHRSLEKSVKLLRLNGLEIGKNNEKFGYFIHPQSQNLENMRRLFVYRRN